MNQKKVTDEAMTNWLEKIQKYAQKEETMSEYPKRGDIWTMDFGLGVGSEIRGKRPVVILSSSIVNEKMRTVTVLPVTNRSELTKRGRNPEDEVTFHLPLSNELFQWGEDRVHGVIKTEAIYTKSRGCIGQRIGRLNGKGIDLVMEHVKKTLLIDEPINPEIDYQKLLLKEERRLEYQKNKLKKQAK